MKKNCKCHCHKTVIVKIGRKEFEHSGCNSCKDNHRKELLEPNSN